MELIWQNELLYCIFKLLNINNYSNYLLLKILEINIYDRKL